MGGVSRGSGPGSTQSSGARGGRGLLEPKTRPSHRGSVVANDRREASVSGRWNLGGVREVQLRGDGSGY